MIGASQEEQFAGSVGWYWQQMDPDQRSTRQLLARHMSRFTRTQEMFFPGSFQPAYFLAIYICAQTQE